LADYILIAAAVLIFFGIGFGVLRLALGPTVIDRIAAVDALTIVSISERFIYLDAALVYGVLSFLAVLAVARYLERGL